MSDNDRGDRGALIALALVVAAIVLITVFGWWRDPSNYGVGQPASDYTRPNQNADIAQSVASGNNFNPWLDSYAQWIMAGLSVAATAVSVWAVRLLRRTLRETQETNRIQTDALKWQRRAISAWEGPSLVVSKLSVQFTHERGFDCKVKVKNEGKNTAFVKGIAIYQNISPNTPENIPFKDTAGGGTFGIGYSLEIDSDTSRPPPHLIDQRLFDGIVAQKVNYYFCCRITYADLFGTTFEWVLIGKIIAEKVGETGYRFMLIEPTPTSGFTYLTEKQDERKV